MIMQALSSDFCDVLSRKYAAALDSGDLLYSGESAEVEFLSREINGSKYHFHLTKLKSLEQRPDKGDVSSNPFEKPEPELTVLDTFGGDNEFRVVLNKFPVVPAHFMLVTKSFKSQDTPLSPNELVATFSILSALSSSDTRKNWFAFYNCGPASGASQPHKHVQFMSLPDDFHPFVEKLVQSSEHYIPSQTREPLQDANLPFAHFVAKLPDEGESDSEEVFLMTFYSLVQRVLNVLKDHSCEHISYNFCATTKYMMLVPRREAKYEGIGINSCGFMGLILCKNDDVSDLMKQKGFENILSQVGFPNTSGCTSDEYHY
ncbi:hypothetical protein JCM33374_g564 [Metschnikowia sp. JCM 33374]|nr:hypothetical protein JCM33374_g564 [Metschnikowia sp. JCM 33374]